MNLFKGKEIYEGAFKEDEKHGHGVLTTQHYKYEGK